jgi:hypothetical protein
MAENEEESRIGRDKDGNVTVPGLTAVATFTANAPTSIIWQPFAQFHFHSAYVLYKKVVEVEDRYDGSQQSRDALTDEHMAYVTGTVFAAVAFLEALINETFLRAVKPDDVLQQLSPNVIASMARAWKYKVNWGKEPMLRDFVTKKDTRCPERWYTLNKYQLALYFADIPPYKRPFVKNGKFWKDIDLLIELRNALIHHKPESVSFPPTGDPYQAETTRNTSLLQELNKRNFTNALWPGEGSLLTLLGSKCASWAVILIGTIAREFRDRMPLDLSSLTGL